MTLETGTQKHLPRGILDTIGRHIEKGPNAVKPSVATENYGLREELRLTQFHLGVGIRSTLALFVPVPESIPASLPCVIRFVEWNRDRTPRSWPDIDVKFFRLRPEDYDPLNTKVVELDTAALRTRIKRPGIDFKEFYTESENRNDELEDVSHLYQRGVFHSPGPAFEIWFFDYIEAPVLNSAWLALWEEIVGRCRDQDRLECKEFYELSPTALREALLADYSDDPPPKPR